MKPWGFDELYSFDQSLKEYEKVFILISKIQECFNQHFNGLVTIKDKWLFHEYLKRKIVDYLPKDKLNEEFTKHLLNSMEWMPSNLATLNHRIVMFFQYMHEARLSICEGQKRSIACKFVLTGHVQSCYLLNCTTQPSLTSIPKTLCPIGTNMTLQEYEKEQSIQHVLDNSSQVHSMSMHFGVNPDDTLMIMGKPLIENANKLSTQSADASNRAQEVGWRQLILNLVTDQALQSSCKPFFLEEKYKKSEKETQTHLADQGYQKIDEIVFTRLFDSAAQRLMKSTKVLLDQMFREKPNDYLTIMNDEVFIHSINCPGDKLEFDPNVTSSNDLLVRFAVAIPYLKKEVSTDTILNFAKLDKKLHVLILVFLFKTALQLPSDFVMMQHLINLDGMRLASKYTFPKKLEEKLIYPETINNLHVTEFFFSEKATDISEQVKYLTKVCLQPIKNLVELTLTGEKVFGTWDSSVNLLGVTESLKKLGFVKLVLFSVMVKAYLRIIQRLGVRVPVSLSLQMSVLFK